MGENYKGVLAANKAVNTLRLNLLSKTNLGEVIVLSNEIIAKEFEIDDDFSKDGIIAREVSKTSWKSFCRFGSRRNSTKGLILTWIDNNATPLDEQALNMSDYYFMEILPDELADFILNYPKGKSQYQPYIELDELKKTFMYLTGFHWNLKFVRKEILTKNTSYIKFDDGPF